MKQLQDILYKVPIEGIFGNPKVKISSISFDSRNIKKNSLFIAQKGNQFDGNQFISKAIKTGKLQYHGHPETMRQYIHVEDAAKASVVALDDDFINQSVILTGQEPMKVFDLIKMIGEILNLPENSVEFSDKNSLGHYVRTPYTSKSNIGRKYIPPMHVDLGQGIIQGLPIKPIQNQQVTHHFLGASIYHRTYLCSVSDVLEWIETYKYSIRLNLRILTEIPSYINL